MAAELKQSRGIDAKLIQGSGGVFEVVVDGKLVFSKKLLGRFPEKDEIAGLIPAA